MENIYKIKSTPSSVSHPHQTEWDTIIGKINGIIVAFNYDSIKVLEYDQITAIDWNDIVKLRAFNEHEELYIWRSNGILKSRYRVDDNDKEESTDYIEVTAALDAKLTKENGPISKGKKLAVRNYLKKGQAYYNDYRFIKFI
jgi:hypothetical protein